MVKVTDVTETYCL